MELEGKVHCILELTEGTSAKGVWKKQNVVIETASAYPKKVCVAVWGDNVNALANLKEGDKVSLSVDIESREFNGKWYTDVKAFRVGKAGSATSPTSQPASSGNAPTSDNPPMPDQNSFDSIFSSEEDLVF